MKTKLHSLFFVLALLALATLNAHLATAFAQGTAFTYQGRLNDTNGPGNGIYDFIFIVYPDTNTSLPLVSGYPVAAVPVSNGLFVATIDFGSGVFNGSDRWLGISVRTNGAAVYAPLSPRQKITPTPYAVLAQTVAIGGLAAGTYSNAFTLNNPANQMTGAFTGNGGGLTNVGATTLGGFAAANFWKTTGNGSTTPGVNFVGTTDNQALELKVNGARALRLEPNTNGAPSLIGGSSVNFVLPGTVGAVISGGGATNYSGSSYTNSVAADFGAIGGGVNNTIQSYANSSAIGGGYGNTIQQGSTVATIGGGARNMILVDAYNSTIGGGVENQISGTGSVIGGGGRDLYTSSVRGNMITAADSVIGGGGENSILSNIYSGIGGGKNNTIQTNASASTIAGGDSNLIQDNAYQSVIGGGFLSTIQPNASRSTIGGGANNTNTGSYATVPGGDQNVAGQNSFAAGHRAKANYPGTFVWADSTDADFASTGNNQFLIRAAGGVGIGVNNVEAPLHVAPNAGGGGIIVGVDAFGGGYTALQMDVSSISNGYAKLQAIKSSGSAFGNLVLNAAGGNVGIGTNAPVYPLEMGSGAYCSVAGVWTSVSDRNVKENFTAITPGEVLAKVASLPITQWKYKIEPSGIKHIGPVAQDFHAAFGLGDSDKAIGSVDESGVALAAIQGLNQKLESEAKAKDAEIEALKQNLAELKKLVQTIVEKK
jgi:hypothetical protein